MIFKWSRKWKASRAAWKEKFFGWMRLKFALIAFAVMSCGFYVAGFLLFISCHADRYISLLKMLYTFQLSEWKWIKQEPPRLSSCPENRNIILQTYIAHTIRTVRKWHTQCELNWIKTQTWIKPLHKFVRPFIRESVDELRYQEYNTKIDWHEKYFYKRKWEAIDQITMAIHWRSNQMANGLKLLLFFLLIWFFDAPIFLFRAHRSRFSVLSFLSSARWMD